MQPQAKECWKPLKDGTSNEQFSLTISSKEPTLLTPDFNPLGPFWTSDLQNCKIITTCCFKCVVIWYSNNRKLLYWTPTGIQRRGKALLARIIYFPGKYAIMNLNNDQKVKLRFCSTPHCCCLVTKLGPTLQPQGLSSPGFPIFNLLPESSQTHIHWVGDAN